MTEIEKLLNLRNKLVNNRRALVESYLKVEPRQFTGEALARLQNAIDAVDRAIDDERCNESSAPQARTTQSRA